MCESVGCDHLRQRQTFFVRGWDSSCVNGSGKTASQKGRTFGANF